MQGSMIRLIVCLALLAAVDCQWNTEELALYDLVEEVGKNFYEFYGISKGMDELLHKQSLEDSCEASGRSLMEVGDVVPLTQELVYNMLEDATLNEVKKAYRKLSLEWHPDRNSADDATQIFRQVTGIYEVLKSKELREKYDYVVEFGLPSWKQPIFYYRRMRKLTWYEGLLVLLFISTIAHYLMMWAHYFEKSLVYNQSMKKLRGKKDKNQKKEEEADALKREALDPFRPKSSELLPILLAKAFYTLIGDVIIVARAATRKEPEPEEEEGEVQRRRPVPSTPQPVFEFAVARDMKPVSTNDPESERKYAAESEIVAKKQSGGSWKPDELANLVRLSTEKYPAGTPNRWEQMGRMLNRSPEDVIAMAGKLKQMKQEEYTKLVCRQQSAAVNESSNTPTATSDESSRVDDWSQAEQRAFEQALQKYPKGTEERWDRIAEAMGSKSKKQCMLRFKDLTEMIRKRKVDG